MYCYSVSSTHLFKFFHFIMQNEETRQTAADCSSSVGGHPEASESFPAVKKLAMAELFGDLF